MFSADELNLLESIANSEVKSLESCAALKKSLHPTPKVVPPSPPARPVVAPTHCVAEENPSSPSTLRSVSKSPDRDVQSDTSPVNKGALVEKRATMFSQLVDSIFDEVSDVE